MLLFAWIQISEYELLILVKSRHCRSERFIFTFIYFFISKGTLDSVSRKYLILIGPWATCQKKTMFEIRNVLTSLNWRTLKKHNKIQSKKRWAFSNRNLEHTLVYYKLAGFTWHCPGISYIAIYLDIYFCNLSIYLSIIKELFAKFIVKWI